MTRYFLLIFLAITSIATKAQFYKSVKVDSVFQVPRLTTDPVNAQNGYVYYNTNSNKIRVFEDNTWKDMVIAGTGSGSVSSVGIIMPAGFTVSNSPITNTGNLEVGTNLSGVVKADGTGFTAGTVNDNEISSISWSKVTTTPTTLGGYGITDAGTVSSVGIAVPSGLTVSNSPVTTSGNISIGTNLSGVVKANGTGFIAGNVTNSEINDISWNKVTNTPTTMAGYGITDADKWTVLNKTSDQLPVATNSDITNLVFNAAAGKKYLIDGYVLFTSSVTNNGCKIGINGPTGSSLVTYNISVPTSGSAQSLLNAYQFEQYTTANATGAVNRVFCAKLSGIIATGTTAGNIALRLRAATGPGVITIKAGSTLLFREL